MLSDCSKDEILDHYNNIVQSAGAIELTGKSSLEGTKEKGIDDYTGTYTADYEDFSDTEYLFGGTSIKREAGKERQSEIQRQYPGYSGAAECSPVCHQAAGYHRPVHLGKPQDRLALQPHPFPRCVPQISGRSGRCPLAHTAQLPPHLCVADAGVGRGHPDHPEHRRPCRHRDD